MVTYCPLHFDFSGSTNLALADQDGPGYGAMEEGKNERRNLASGNISNGSARSRSLFRFHQCLRENLGDAHDLFNSPSRGLRVRIFTHGNDTAGVVLVIKPADS